jgi:membrane protease YdiL (CAAX protease family)
MTQFHKKNPLGFALMWIGTYVVSLSFADALSQSLGVEKLLTAPLCLVLTAFLFYWVKRQALLETYGLAHSASRLRPWKDYWPLLLIISTNLWGGVALQYSVPETLLYVLSMLCVGFLEELIFRGFLFRALCRDNLKTAILISSVTFGVGHIINLLNGAALGATLLQIVYAVAIGFAFTYLFLAGGSIWPCILCHSVINGLSAFAPPSLPMEQELLSAGFLCVVSIGYGLYLSKKFPLHDGQED